MSITARRETKTSFSVILFTFSYLRSLFEYPNLTMVRSKPHMILVQNWTYPLIFKQQNQTAAFVLGKQLGQVNREVLCGSSAWEVTSLPSYRLWDCFKSLHCSLLPSCHLPDQGRANFNPRLLMPICKGFLLEQRLSRGKDAFLFGGFKMVLKRTVAVPGHK